MNSELYPLTLEPIVIEQFWRRTEQSFLDEAIPREFTQGTLWMATENSRISAGPQSGRSLAYLKQTWGSDLVGSSLGGDLNGPIPVELKLKRTGENATAVALTEDSLWYFLDAEEDSFINTGYLEGLDFEQAAAEAGFDPQRWAKFMPEYPAESGTCLMLPEMSPLLLGPGLAVAQISPPARSLPQWPLPGRDPQALELARASRPPQWHKPDQTESGLIKFSHSERLKILMVTASEYSGMVSPEAATFIWPLSGQGRIRSRGPAPTTRLQPGKVTMLPAALGRFTIESAGKMTFLYIEAR